MTNVSEPRQVTDRQVPEASESESAEHEVDDRMSLSAQRLAMARGPMSAEVAVMFSLLMRQMDRLRELAFDRAAAVADSDEGSAPA